MTTTAAPSTRPGRQRTARTLVDADIHPHALAPDVAARLAPAHRRRWEMFGSRVPGPPEIYPRVRNAGFRVDAWPDGGFPGSDLGMVRDQLLDEFDVDHGILIPLQGHSWGVEAPEYAAALCGALNTWIREEWLDREPRLRSSIAVPHEAPDLAAAEIRRRAGDPGFVQVLLSTGTELSVGRRNYWPIFAAAAEAGLPIAAHTGGLAQHRSAGWPSFYLEEHVWNGNTMAALLMSFLLEGVFEEFPTLQLVLIEGGIAWAGPLLWALDQAWATLREDVPHLRRPPSEIVRERVWFTTQPIEEPDDPRHLELALRHLDMDDRILFASDYPHWDFDSPRHAPRSFPSAIRDTVMGANACRLYGLPARDAG
ncbi:amidohydrolase family protein [Actinomycetospora sp. C-140]